MKRSGLVPIGLILVAGSSFATHVWNGASVRQRWDEFGKGRVFDSKIPSGTAIMVR